MQPLDIPLASVLMPSSAFLIIGPLLAVIIYVYVLIKSQSTFWGRVNTILKNLRSIVTLGVICFVVILIILFLQRTSGKGGGSQGGIGEEASISGEDAGDSSKVSTLGNRSKNSIIIQLSHRENMIRVYGRNDTTPYSIRMDGDIDKELHHALKLRIGNDLLYARNDVTIQAEDELIAIPIPFRLRVHSILKKHNLLPHYTGKTKNDN